MSVIGQKPGPRRWIVLLSLLAGIGAAWLTAVTPRPQGPEASPGEFSTGRAMADVRVIAARPHPSGSAEITRVRDYLVLRLQSMGLSPEVQSGEGLLKAGKRKPGVVIAGRTDNVIGVLPGRDRNAPAVLIMSHYDTMPNTPGAGDATTGTAVALELARLLAADKDRVRDVIFLLTDGEEPGLLGAQSFFSASPHARRVGIVINLEARGDTGRTTMFETSRDAGELVRLLGAKSPGLNANSLTIALYRIMANDTDLTVALDRGYTGLNFAFVGDQLAYHTSLSTPDHLDTGSVQHMGAAVLPVARSLVKSTALPRPAADLTYSDLMGQVLVAYPAWVGWLLFALAGGLVAFSAVVVIRRGLAGGYELARGGAGMVLALCATALSLHLAGRWLGGEDSVRVYALVARYPLLLAGATTLAIATGAAVISGMAHGGRRWPFAVAAIVAGAACSLGGFDLVGTVLGAVTAGLALVCLGRSTSLWGFWAGSLIAGLLLAAAVQALAPSGGFLVQWPLLLGALAAAALLGFDINVTSRRGLAILGGVAAIGFAQISSWGGFFFLQMGPVLPELLALLVPSALFVLAPGLHVLGQGWGGRWLPLLALLVGAALLVLAGASGWAGSPRQLTQVFYLADPGEKRFYRASATKGLDSWSRAVLGGQPTSERMPLVSSGRIWLAPAPAIGMKGPQITAETTTLGGKSQIKLRVRPGAGGRQLKLLIQPTSGLGDLTLNGRPLDTLRETSALSLDRVLVIYTAPPADGIVLGFQAPLHGKVTVEALEFRDGWPPEARPVQPRPKALLTWGLSDTTVVRTKQDISW